MCQCDQQNVAHPVPQRIVTFLKWSRSRKSMQAFRTRLLFFDVALRALGEQRAVGQLSERVEWASR